MTSLDNEWIAQHAARAAPIPTLDELRAAVHHDKQFPSGSHEYMRPVFALERLTEVYFSNATGLLPTEDYRAALQLPRNSLFLPEDFCGTAADHQRYWRTREQPFGYVVTCEQYDPNAARLHAACAARGWPIHRSRWPGMHLGGTMGCTLYLIAPGAAVDLDPLVTLLDSLT